MSLDEVGCRSWATTVKNLLFNYGFGFMRISQDFGDIDMFILTFKQRLYVTLNHTTDIDQ